MTTTFNPQSAIHNLPATVRLLAACPKCSCPIPPDYVGVILTRRGPRRTVRLVAHFCAGCQRYWIVQVSRPSGAWTADEIRYTAPRPASPVEAKMARRRVFLARGRPEPSE